MRINSKISYNELEQLIKVLKDRLENSFLKKIYHYNGLWLFKFNHDSFIYDPGNTLWIGSFSEREDGKKPSGRCWSRFFQTDCTLNMHIGENMKDVWTLITQVCWPNLFRHKNCVSDLEDFDKKQVFEIDNVTHLKSDLPKKVDRVLDSHLFENKLFISFESREKDKCKNFMIYVTDINKEIIEFDKFFEDKSCKTILNSGRMQDYVIDGREGLLFAASAAIYDKPNTEPQDENSNFGKILFKDFKTNEVSIISKGHRLILGLLVNEDNSIIATENGPRGGDEINKIILGGNYGWPLASYGRRYDSDYEDNPLNYKQDHESNGYIEPIFTFIPSIGISEIIKIPNEFIRNWIDNYLIASLNKRALFRVKFNKDRDKLLFYEEIYIGSRIRDLKYSKRTKSILLALEDRAVLGILKSN